MVLEILPLFGTCEVFSFHPSPDFGKRTRTSGCLSRIREKVKRLSTCSRDIPNRHIGGPIGGQTPWWIQ